MTSFERQSMKREAVWYLAFRRFSIAEPPNFAARLISWRIKLMANSKRTRFTLECTECKHRNYNMTKDKKTHPERMETSKYCPFCRKHTPHKETK